MTATTSSGPSPYGAPPPDDRVPADRRWAGFDRRTIGPALLVLVFMLLMHVGLPTLDDAVDYDDRVESGDQLNLTHGITSPRFRGGTWLTGYGSRSPGTARPRRS